MILESLDLRLLVPSLGVFLTIVVAAIGILFIMRDHAQRKVRDRLNDVIIAPFGDEEKATQVIIRDLELSSVPFLNALLKDVKWAYRLDNLLVQADMKMRVGRFVLLMLVVGAASAMLVLQMTNMPLAALPTFFIAGWMPVLYARRRKAKRILQFEKQFPDALEMLTNALRAGMALNGAIQVVAEECPDPVGKEFGIVFEENRLGLDMRDALKKLAGRVDSNELHLFVTAVILQRETGGNLAEILEGTAAVIRDRFRILGDVRTLTAQGKMSGIILTALPIFMTAVILTVAPDYLKGLLADPIGKYLIAYAIGMQLVGYVVMRRIVDIKV